MTARSRLAGFISARPLRKQELFFAMFMSHLKSHLWFLETSAIIFMEIAMPSDTEVRRIALKGDESVSTV